MVIDLTEITSTNLCITLLFVLTERLIQVAIVMTAKGHIAAVT